jgi:hypothetical protein
MKKKSKGQLKNIIIIILVVLVIILLFKHPKPAISPKETPLKVSETKPTPTIPAISITTENIKEDNFTGTKPIINGSNTLAIEARKYVDDTISNFRIEANKDVPDMRAKFGADSPPATYTIDIEAKYKEGVKTDSIVMSAYAYTGGANGNSSYKVINASHTSGKILSLYDIIQSDKQSAFTNYVKKQLNSWIPDGNTAPVVFPDVVKDLTFASFTNWSINDTNLIIYFDKYEVGPGVLGAITFPIKVINIKDFLVSNFI